MTINFPSRKTDVPYIFNFLLVLHVSAITSYCWYCVVFFQSCHNAFVLFCLTPAIMQVFACVVFPLPIGWFLYFLLQLFFSTEDLAHTCVWESSWLHLHFGRSGISVMDSTFAQHLVFEADLVVFKKINRMYTSPSWFTWFLIP